MAEGAGLPPIDHDRPLNRRRRREAIIGRDGAECVWCRRPFAGLVTPTTEHLIPRLKGGPSWIENEVAACRRCNAERGHRNAGDWLDACELRGWEPNRPVVIAALEALSVAITERGGQRRARRQLESQLRRLRR